MPEFYAESCLNYGQIVKIRSGGKIVDKMKSVIYGNPDYEDIETTNVENFNGILRGHGTASKKIEMLFEKSNCGGAPRSLLRGIQ